MCTVCNWWFEFFIFLLLFFKIDLTCFLQLPKLSIIRELTWWFLSLVWLRIICSFSIWLTLFDIFLALRSSLIFRILILFLSNMYCSSVFFRRFTTLKFRLESFYSSLNLEGVEEFLASIIYNITITISRINLISNYLITGSVLTKDRVNLKAKTFKSKLLKNKMILKV